ncbi:MAG: FMN-binding protein [Flavobacteriaceae bacterium]|nr:MAG: FMN-binding protein [Flavobacteriaceae bacterium]
MVFYKKPFIGLFLLTTFLLAGFGLPKTIQKKVDKEIEKVFEVDYYATKFIEVPNELNANLPAKISDSNLFAIFQGEKKLGYAFVDKALSKTASFDYLVVFDTDLKVVHSKVLVYREDYGGEIGSKRWLRQFLGKTGKDRVNHKTNIDAIAGATISVQSMTKSMDDLLQTIGILQENKIL